MKKSISRASLLILILILIFTLLLTTVCMAAKKVYHIDELYMDIEFDDDYTVFTAETDPNDGTLSTLGLSYASLISNFSQNGIVLEAFGEGFTHEIVIYSSEDSTKPYKSLDSEELYHSAKLEDEEFTKDGKSVTSSDIIETENNVYIKTDAQTDKNNRTIQYSTIINGHKVKIQLISYEFELTENIISNFNDMIEKIRFTPDLIVDKTTKSDAEETISSVMPTIKKDMSNSDNPYKNSDSKTFDLKSTLISFLVFFGIFTIPVAVLRFAVVRQHIPKKVSACFAVLYAILSAAVVFFAADNIGFEKYLCACAVIWGFIIYKIMK